MHLYALLNIIQNVTVVAASIALVLFFGMGVMGAVIGFVGPTILIGILCPVLICEYIGFDISLWNIPALRATTVFGFYVVLGNSIGFLNAQVDSILIGYYMNPTEVGIYAVAVLLAQTLTLTPECSATGDGAGDGDPVWEGRYRRCQERCFLDHEEEFSHLGGHCSDHCSFGSTPYYDLFY